MPPKKKKATRPAKRPRTRKNPRDKINVLALIEALEQHVLGEKEMTASQVSAALALLKKTLPDMTEQARRAASADGAHENALRELE